MTAALICEDLSVRYPGGNTPVRNVSFCVSAGECFALVGGSGAGKSSIARALLGLHGAGAKITGALSLNGQDMSRASADAWRRLRGRGVGFVAQNPWSSCDPLRPVGDHVAEAWRCHGLPVTWQAIAKALTALDIPNVGSRQRQYPHTWSGGMLQRASIAAASALTPPIVIADEPTSALDADRAQKVLDALRALGCAVLLISHDMDLVMRNADRIGVLYQGLLVETDTPEVLLKAPAHQETRRLLGALEPLPPRQAPANPTPLIRLRDVSVAYKRGQVQALKPVDLEVGEAEIVGIQGASGSGKSTLLRLVMGLEAPSRGSLWRSEALTPRGALLPIFQDPIGSLVPHWPVWRSVAEPLLAKNQSRRPVKERQERALEALNTVGLGSISPDARPSELSVGQCQRVAIARATITQPALIVADEPTSALDSVSIQQVSKLLRQAAEKGTAVLLVSHDKGFLNRMADRTISLGG
ncbi:ABC transporter ATP-binding protein [Shimia sp. R10_1]|uniref:ABC transporter ATP-binding protein n=1 Tax=Shimia sp. R10_1 TaxID=2821095 RepID=UPI001AD95466|nr:ABC transporter ATP-binding protein [Shimia sp. R10_1]MBO9474128.1 ABC transporter ATP-binding protein [Shimia sp. R10_1]